MGKMIYAETGSTDPAFNLAFEQYILENKPEGDWLMLWQNENTVVVGRNQLTAAEIDEDFVRANNITVVRRMTGGGAVYHDLGNLNYSFITDLGNAAELSIERFARPVCTALEKLGVQAELSGRNDILAEGKKVSGVAQRIYKDRILHHGTLFFDSKSDTIVAALRPDPKKFTSKSAKSVRSRVGNIRELLPVDMSIDRFWQAILQELSGEAYERYEPTAEELSEIEKLADEKYRSWDWNFGHSPLYGFENSIRCPGGSLRVSMDVEKGMIKRLAFSGDYMALADDEAVVAALVGLPHERGAVKKALGELGEALCLSFGGIGAEEILSAMF